MTIERFDQFKNKILKLSQEADVFWEQFNELKTTKNMVVRLARKQKLQIDQTEEELQKASEEIKIIKFELKQAHEKIKELEKGKKELVPSDLHGLLPIRFTDDVKSCYMQIEDELEKAEYLKSRT